MSDENHGPTLQEVYAHLADHYGHGWLAGKESACRCVCHNYPEHGRLQDALEALKWYQEKQTADLRRAWEAGFELCLGYGDNHAYFDGEQKERQWRKYLTESAPVAATGQPVGGSIAVDPVAQTGQEDATRETLL